MKAAWEGAGHPVADAGTGERARRDEDEARPPGPAAKERPDDWREVLGVRGIGLSNHAVQRFKERFGSRFDRYEVARAQLRARLDDGLVWFSKEQPTWIVMVERTKMRKPIADNHVGYLVIDDEIALPLRKGQQRSSPYYAVTCLTRADVYGGGSRDRMSGKNGGRHRRQY